MEHVAALLALTADKYKKSRKRTKKKPLAIASMEVAVGDLSGTYVR